MSEHDESIEPRELLAEYALGVLGEEDAAAVRALIRSDPDAAAEYEEMARVARLLPLAAEEMTPGEHVRTGLLERIQAEGRQPTSMTAAKSLTPIRRWLLPMAAAAAAVVVAVGGAGFLVGRSANDDSDLDHRFARQTTLVEAATRGTLAVTRGEDGPRKMAVAYAPGSSEAFVYVEGLSAPPAGKAFQAWFTRDGRVFEPSAVFSVHDGGVWVSAGGNVHDYAAIGFTIEDADGADAPTQAPFMTLPLGAQARTIR